MTTRALKKAATEYLHRAGMDPVHESDAYRRI